MKASDRINILSESQTLSITKQVRALVAEGHEVVGLTLGEPDYDTPDHIREAAIQAIQEGFTHYTPVAGIPDLRQAIADKYQGLYGLDLNIPNVIVSTGAKQSLVNVIMSLINPGDEVIMLAPYWVSYLEMLKMAEAKPVILHAEIYTGYKITAEELAAAITPQTRMLILNSPNNPTGAMYTREEMAALVRVLEAHPEVVVLSDEIYEYIAYQAPMVSALEFDSIRDRTVVVNGVSKGFAMTGWRIGYAVGPTWIIALCEKYQGQITSGTNSIAQRAALAAFTGPLEPTERMREGFRERRNWMAQRLHEIPNLQSYDPPGAFYFYPDFSPFFGRRTPKGIVIEDIDMLCKYLLLEGLVAIIPGTAFGTTKHARISYAYSMETLEKGILNLEKALAALT